MLKDFFERRTIFPCMVAGLQILSSGLLENFWGPQSVKFLTIPHGGHTIWESLGTAKSEQSQHHNLKI